jgi:hypothetical protein
MTVSKHNAALKLLTEGGVALDVIMDALAAEEAPESPKEHVFVERHPVAVPITLGDRQNMRQIVTRVEEFQFPDGPVELTEAQLRAAIPTFNDIKKAKKVLERAEEAFGHVPQPLDVLVEESRDKRPVRRSLRWTNTATM